MRGVSIEKKPSVDCSMLPVLMPSIVMLTVLFGRPLMTAPRGPPVVATPGSSATAYSALRDDQRQLAQLLDRQRRRHGVGLRVCTSSVPALTSIGLGQARRLRAWH